MENAYLNSLIADFRKLNTEDLQKKKAEDEKKLCKAISIEDSDEVFMELEAINFLLTEEKYMSEKANTASDKNE